MNSATISDSLSGAMNGEMTLVAINDVPAGSFSISGRATSVNSSFWKNASGTKQARTTMTDRSSRSRSSRRCETSVPSARDSPSDGLWLIGGRLVRRRGRLRPAGFSGAAAASCAGAARASSDGAGGGG